MQYLKIFTLPLMFALLAACSDGGDSRPDAGPRLDLAFVPAPIDLPGITASFAQDIRYGSGERNLFDIYLPDCDGPTPLAIYIHGGGFTGGDKSGTHTQNEEIIRELLQSCVAYATINYFLLDVPEEGEPMTEAAAQGGVLTSLQDAARALQFMRYHAASLDIEVENVALFGGSAGAGASLWLGTHDDMADPDNEDPVLRESTRIKAVGALATQSTYNILAWDEILRPITASFGEVDVPTLAAFLEATNYLLTFLGEETLEALDSPDNIAYRANIDMLALMDAGDAPIFVQNWDTGFDNPMNMFLHHGLHALAVKDRADMVGLESVAYVEEDDPQFVLTDPSGETLASFLIRHIR